MCLYGKSYVMCYKPFADVYIKLIHAKCGYMLFKDLLDRSIAGLPPQFGEALLRGADQ